MTLSHNILVLTIQERFKIKKSSSEHLRNSSLQLNWAMGHTHTRCFFASTPLLCGLVITKIAPRHLWRSEQFQHDILFATKMTGNFRLCNDVCSSFSCFVRRSIPVNEDSPDNCVERTASFKWLCCFSLVELCEPKFTLIYSRSRNIKAHNNPKQKFHNDLRLVFHFWSVPRSW